MKISPTIGKVLTFIKKNILFSPGDKCLLAVSGGFDSVALLEILYQINKLLQIEIGVAHVNYQLRGTFSAEEEIFVRKICEEKKIPFFSLKVKQDEFKSGNNSGWENKARKIRYEFFRQVAGEQKYNKIVLAHNANDQAETFLMRMVRGSISGLKGIIPKRAFSPEEKNLLIVRPLLCLERREIEKYLSEKGIEAKTDLSNFEDIYTRNRFRKQILPMLLAENPAFLENVRQITQVINEEDLYLQNKADLIFKKAFLKKEKGMLILSAEKLKEEVDLILRRIWKRAYQELSGDLYSLDFKHLEEIKTLLRKNISGKLIELPGGYFFTKDRDYLIFCREKPDFSVSEFCHLTSGEEAFFIKENGVTVPPILCGKTLALKNYQPDLFFLLTGKKTKTSLKEFLDKKRIPQVERKKIVLIFVQEKLSGIFCPNLPNHFFFKQFDEKI